MGNDGRKACNDKPDVLLNELGSLQEILGETPEQGAPHTSLEQISSVEEYLRIKQLATSHGLTIEQYLSQNSDTDTADKGSQETSSEQENPPASVDAYFRSVAANKKRSAPRSMATPQPDDQVPVLNEVASGSDLSGSVSLTAHEVHQLVELIVNRKLQEIRGKLKEEVLAELQRVLPHTHE